MSGAAGEAWDSNVASRVVPGSGAAELIELRAELGTPIAIPAPAWAEMIAGYEDGVRRGRVSASLRFAHAWLRAAVDSGDVEVLPFDETAARAAGIVRGSASLQRPKGWDVDVSIAAVCWSNGYTLVTRNRLDFEEIGLRLSARVGGQPLRVRVPAPE